VTVRPVARFGRPPGASMPVETTVPQPASVALDQVSPTSEATG